MSEFANLQPELRALTNEYDELSVEFKRMVEDSARKRHALDMARAGALLRADSKLTIDRRKAEVDQQCDKQELDAHLAENYVKAAEARMRALNSLISVVQSKVRYHTNEMMQFRADV